MSYVRTVGGDVSPDTLGVTLPHEHLLVNLMQEYRLTGLLHDVDLMAEEIIAFRDLGGGTIVDVTTAEIARGTSPRLLEHSGQDDGCALGTRPSSNTEGLVALAHRSGLNIIAGTGHYRDPYLDRDWFDRTSVDQIAERIVADIEDGFPGTDARAGVIGEIGADKWYISAAEERSFRAAARAHLRTGLAVTTHAARWPVGLDQVDLLLAEGVPPEKIIVGHTDSVPNTEYALALAARGVYVQLDMFFQCLRAGTLVEHELTIRLDTIMALVAAGRGGQILLSHDICLRDHLLAGGGAGFGFLLSQVSPALQERGLAKDQIVQFMTTNPSRALAV